MLPEAVSLPAALSASTDTQTWLDVRPASQFIEGHLAEAVNLPWPQLMQCQHLLPSSQQELRVLHAAGQQAALAWLQQRGYRLQSWCWQSDWQAELQSLRRWHQGPGSGRLWAPNPLLAQWVDYLEQACTGRRALDLACGAGRDSMFLAMRGWQVTALDYLPEHLAKLQQVAEGQPWSIATQLQDLNQPASLPAELDLLLVFRYLNRRLWPALRQAIRPGGFLLYQTFQQGAEQFGSPKNPNYLLAPDELAQQFADWQLIFTQVDHLADGRPLQSILVRKPVG